MTRDLVTNRIPASAAAAALILLLTCWVSVPVRAQTPVPTARVKYVSAEHVYIDAGAGSGILVGDTLSVSRDDHIFAKLVVVYVANQSASCEISSAEGPLEVGDPVLIQVREEVTPATQSSRQDTSKTLPLSELRPVDSAYDLPRPPARVDGSFALQYYHFNDRNAANLDFTQPTVRINLRATNLWTERLSFRAISRTRYNARTRAYSDVVPKDKWRSSIYLMALFYNADTSTFSLQLGRLIINRIGGVGYIDGAAVQLRPTSSVAIGGFAGYQPEWQYAEFQSQLHKYGLYVSYQRGQYSGVRFQSTGAFAAEYHSSMVSRQYAYLQTSFTNGARWQLYQSATVDFNGDWRKAKTDQSLNLTWLYLSGRYRLSNRVSVMATYDSFENYWTWELRSLADSLFDDNIRRGVRGYIYITLPHALMLNGSVGYRKREGDSEASRSFTGGISRAGLTPLQLHGMISVAAFSSFYSDGYNFSTRWSRYLAGGHRLSASYDRYSYRYDPGGARRTSNSYGVAGDFRLPDNLHLMLGFEYSTGADINGQRILSELGYRF